MRRVSMFIVGCAVFALAVTLFGQAKDLDTLMKEINPIWNGVQGGAPGLATRGGTALLDAATPDTAKIAADAAKLEGLFREAEAQFTKLKMTEAAGMAKDAADASGNLAKEAKTGKIADAKAAKAAIGKCGGCHGKFRDSDGAGGYKVKAQ